MNSEVVGIQLQTAACEWRQGRKGRSSSRGRGKGRGLWAFTDIVRQVTALMAPAYVITGQSAVKIASRRRILVFGVHINPLVYHKGTSVGPSRG